MLTQNTF